MVDSGVTLRWTDYVLLGLVSLVLFGYALSNVAR
jgi:hypothetical protein